MTDMLTSSGGLRARAPCTPHRGHHQRRRDADAVLRPALRRAGARADRHRLLVLRVLGLPCRPRLLVHLGDRLDRRGAADQRVARRDGCGVGAVRGLHQAADRRRSRPRWCTGSASPRQARCVGCWHFRPTRTRVAPLWPDSVSMAGLQARLRPRRRQVDSRADGPGGARLVRGRRAHRLGEAGRRASTNCSPGRTSPIRCAATTSRRSPTARRRSCSPRAIGPGSSAKIPPG